MKISSSDFKEGDKFPITFSGEGANVSPNLLIENVPEKTKSLVLTLEDPDAEKICGHVWVHWVLFNIPVEKNIEIRKNSYLGIKGLNDYGKLNYSGPMPPKASGTHRYYFKVFALDCELDLSEGAKLDVIQKSMKNHILEKSEFYGTYWRD